MVPKAELHVHLEGCLDAEQLFRLAERNDVALPWPTIDELRGAYRFADLPSFLTLYFEGCRVLNVELLPDGRLRSPGLLSIPERDDERIAPYRGRKRDRRDRLAGIVRRRQCRCAAAGGRRDDRDAQRAR